MDYDAPGHQSTQPDIKNPYDQHYNISSKTYKKTVEYYILQ